MNSDAIYSRLADDPELGEMVDTFVQRLPDRIRTLEAQAARGSWERLARTAEQLRGAAVSHGFDDLTPYAARVERTAKHPNEQERVLSAVDELLDLCRRVRSGRPHHLWEA